MKKITFICFLILLMTGLSSAWSQDIKSDNLKPRTIYLVRHGFYDWDNNEDPETGKALIPLGMAQARLTAERLRSLPVTMTGFYSSTMTRARQTAQIINRSFPHLELHLKRQLREGEPPAWHENDNPEEEAECIKRWDKAFGHYFVPAVDEEAHDILVSHGNAIRYLVMKTLGVDTRSLHNMAITNCSITTIRINPDGSIRLVSYNDYSHIPYNMQTGLYHNTTDLGLPELK